jgi:hypothetical protein
MQKGLVEPGFMATSGVEDVRDNILGGSFTFFEDSMRD